MAAISAYTSALHCGPDREASVWPMSWVRAPKSLLSIDILTLTPKVIVWGRGQKTLKFQVFFSRLISIESASNSGHKYKPVTCVVIRNSMLLSLSPRIEGGGEKIAGAKRDSKGARCVGTKV